MWYAVCGVVGCVGGVEVRSSLPSSSPGRVQVPARPRLSAFGAEFELSRRPRTSRRAEKVVARPPPTEVSNLKPPLAGGGWHRLWEW